MSDDLRERHDDVVWKVRFADQWLYVYILMAFQSSVDLFVSVRILSYVGLLYKKVSRRLLTRRFIEWVSDTPSLQRVFIVFLKRVYFMDRVEIDTLYRESESADEVTNMLAKNVQRWIEEWKAEGEARGLAEGEHRERLRVAKKMLAAGMTLSSVSEMTGLSEDELEALRDTISN